MKNIGKKKTKITKIKIDKNTKKESEAKLNYTKEEKK